MGTAGRYCAALAAIWIAGVASAHECCAQSGPRRAALVELEGCSTCPPANRLLARFGSAASGDAPGTEIVPLALHVDFRDYIGWKDPFSRAEFAASVQDHTGRDFRSCCMPQSPRAGSATGSARARIAVPCSSTIMSCSIGLRLYRQGGTGSVERTFELTPAQAAKGIPVAAFVQDTRSGEALQTVSAGPCRAA